MRNLLCLMFVVAAFAAPPRYTLPDTVIPLRHVIELTIDPAQDRFTGVARIDVRINKPLSEIWLNARDLRVTEAHIESGGKTFPATTRMEGGEFLGLVLEKPFSAREASLFIGYEAPLSGDSSTGPYHAKTGADWYAFTTFTPTDARRAFPCFDEPRFKTPWEMSIRVKAEQKAFSNGPQVAETTLANGWKLVRFGEMKPIAAEVVAFAVGPFDVYEGKPSGEKAIPVRVLTAKGDGAQGKQAALETMEILPRLERYTGIPYPWEKLDHVALPRSAFGAVENPGLITYNSAGLLTASGRSIRSLQAHEIGHQWFGNLVTQASWLDVWLSEGFATWFAARTMDEEEPADRKGLAAVGARERIMQVDDGPETRPVRLERQTREEMRSVYNRLVYQKGGSILMMLENWMGPDAMRAGLRDYLASHALGNATTGDLEAALKGVAKEDPTAVMNGYLNTTGVPRISVEVKCEGEAFVVLKRESGKTSIPVCWRTDTGSSCEVIGDAPKRVAMASCPAWVYPNRHGAGYYRTVWTAGQLTQLGKLLGQLEGAERLTLVYDLKASRLTGKNSMLQRLTQDAEPEIVTAARVALGLEKEEEPLRRPR